MNDHTSKKCPYCESASDFYFVAGDKTFFHCNTCDLIFRIACQDEQDRLLDYYRKNYFTDFAGDQVDGQRDGIFTHALDVIERKKNGGKLLDVGCGCGFLLKEASERGWVVRGVDPSEQSVEYAKTLVAAAVIQCTLQEFHSDERFDVITMINVFDHMTQPWKELGKVHVLLKPGGYVFFRFPNGKLHSLLCGIAQKVNIENHVRRFLIFHEYSLTPKFVKKLLFDHGFGDIDVRNAMPTSGNYFSRYLKMLMYRAAEIFSFVSCRKILLGTSLTVMARKPNP